MVKRRQPTTTKPNHLPVSDVLSILGHTVQPPLGWSVLAGGMNAPDLGVVSTTNFHWSGWFVMVTQVTPRPCPMLFPCCIITAALSVLTHWAPSPAAVFFSARFVSKLTLSQPSHGHKATLQWNHYNEIFWRWNHTNSASKCDAAASGKCWVCTSSPCDVLACMLFIKITSHWNIAEGIARNGEWTTVVSSLPCFLLAFAEQGNGWPQIMNPVCRSHPVVAACPINLQQVLPHLSRAWAELGWMQLPARVGPSPSSRQRFWTLFLIIGDTQQGSPSRTCHLMILVINRRNSGCIPETINLIWNKMCFLLTTLCCRIL